MSGKKERESGQVRRVTSITRKLHRSFILKKLGICVRTDVLLFLLSAASYLTGMEFSRNGWFFREADRALTLGASPGSLIYKVTDAGGTILLAFEHIWHGEVVPWFPFLTAMSNPADAAEMFHEMATVGVVMAILITVVWIGMCAAADAIMKRPAKTGMQKTAM